MKTKNSFPEECKVFFLEHQSSEKKEIKVLHIWEQYAFSIIVRIKFFDAKTNFKQLHTTCFVLRNIFTLENTYSPVSKKIK